MYAYNCNPKRKLLGICPYFLLGNHSLGLSTWQEVIDFLLDTKCIQQTVTAEWVGHSVYTADRLQPSGLDPQCIQQTGYD